MAPGRAPRTAAMASSAPIPNSTSSRAEIVPVRPRPPRQWITTFPPPASRARRSAPACSQRCSHSTSGTPPSGMGSQKWARPAAARLGRSATW